MSDKNYISGILIKEFGEYGQLNVSIKIDDFGEQLNKISNNGWANVVIAKNRNPTEKGYTHHCFENTWKPGKKESQRNNEVQSEPEENINQDGLPF